MGGSRKAKYLPIPLMSRLNATHLAHSTWIRRLTYLALRTVALNLFVRLGLLRHLLSCNKSQDNNRHGVRSCSCTTCKTTHTHTHTHTNTHTHTHTHTRAHQDLDCRVCTHPSENRGAFFPPNLHPKLSRNKERRWARGVTLMTSERACS